jgi:hypothetical protein
MSLAHAPGCLQMLAALVYFIFVIDTATYFTAFSFNPLKPKLLLTTFKNSVRTSKRTPHFTITNINWLILFSEMIPVYSKNHTKSTEAKCNVIIKARGTYSYHSALKG